MALDAVAPADVLPFGVRPAVIGDRHFVDPGARLREPRGELRLDPEPLTTEPQGSFRVSRANGLVAGLHVGQVQIVQDVREPCQDPIPEGVPIQKDPSLGARSESRTEDCICSVLHDRLQQTREIGGVILEIGVCTTAMSPVIRVIAVRMAAPSPDWSDDGEQRCGRPTRRVPGAPAVVDRYCRRRPRGAPCPHPRESRGPVGRSCAAFGLVVDGHQHRQLHVALFSSPISWSNRRCAKGLYRRDKGIPHEGGHHPIDRRRWTVRGDTFSRDPRLPDVTSRGASDRRWLDSNIPTGRMERCRRRGSKRTRARSPCDSCPTTAPRTVENFLGLATGSEEWTDPRDGERETTPLYPGTIFHRVIPGFMVQGATPPARGMGGPGYRIEDEVPVRRARSIGRGCWR